MSDRYPRLASLTVGLPAGDVVTQEDREPSQGPAGTGQGSNDRNERLLPNLFPQGEGYCGGGQESNRPPTLVGAYWF